MSVQLADVAALASAEFRLRRSLVTVIRPTSVRVMLTRVQVHRLFPRLRDRYPLAATVPAADGPRHVYLGGQLECWRIALERNGK